MTDLLLAHVKQLLQSEYDIHGELGRGGMAVVYSAERRRDQRRVAIKVLPPHMALNATARERFGREARLAAALNHPGIVPVYAAAQRDDIAYFVMALVEGESLGKRMARKERFSIADVQYLLAEVADALGYAHAAGVVHRDIKPDNILLDATTGRPVLTDFGIARTLDDDTNLTRENVALGTPTYLSPEQALGAAYVDGRADIYSLGVVGYELLAGRAPFTASATPALLASHVSDRPVPLLELRPDTPPSMVAAIDGALEKKPAARWASAAAFRAALGDLPTVADGITHLPDFTLRLVKGGAQEPAPAVMQRIGRFRRKAIGSLALACLVMLFNVIYDPSFLIFLLVVGLLALDLVLVGSELYAEDVPIKVLFAGKVRGESVDGRPRARPALTGPSATRCEATQRTAARDYAEVRRMLDTLSESERAMIPDAGSAVDALHARIQSLVAQLRETSGHANVDVDRSGGMISRLDSAADGMHALRLGLMNLLDGRFEQGMDEFNHTSERARTLSIEVTGS